MSNDTAARESGEDKEASFDWFHHALRDHSPEAIQKSIAKALSELTGKPYEARVVRLDFTPKWGGPSALARGDTELVVQVSKRNEVDGPF